jgi:hypothetical protein
MKIKGVEIDENVVGRRVTITKTYGGSLLGEYQGREVTVTGFDWTEGEDGPLLTEVDGLEWWIEWDCSGDPAEDFEWVPLTHEPPTPSTKTSRKAMAKGLRFEVDKLNKFINQAELCGMTVVLCQPKTPKKEEY